MTLAQMRIFPGRFDQLAVIGEFVGGVAESAGLDARAVYAVQMAVDEACSNIIEHAYGGEGHGDIECTCQITAEGLTVTLHDRGQPFDPDRIPAPDINAGLEERNGRGLGLFFIRQLMDKAEFDFTPDSGNTLIMLKRRASTPQ